MKKAPPRLLPRRNARHWLCAGAVLAAMCVLLAAFYYSTTKSTPSVSQEELDFERSSQQQLVHPKDDEDEDDDPMAKFIIGYPAKPMTLAELKLCDTKQTIMLSGSYQCATDPSCLACVRPNQADRFREIHQAFRDPDFQQKRDAQLLRDFEGQRTLVMFTFNYAHADLFLNWACSASKLGLDVKKFTLVIPCDDKTHALMLKLGFKVLDPEWQTKLHSQIKQKESFWGQDHADINNIALFAMNDLVQLGFQVFVHDADIAWLRDPFPFFHRAIKRRDFIGMLAPFWTSMGPVNTGLLFLSPTVQSKVFLKSMENAAIIKGTSDQRLWNAVLRHFSFQQLEWRLLPQNIVYKYSGSSAAPPGEDTLLMHAVGSGKREKMARYGLWLLDPKCPFYNEDADRMNAKERVVLKPSTYKKKGDGDGEEGEGEGGEEEEKV